MVDEVLNILKPKKNSLYVDATFGQGGYSLKLLEKSNCTVIGIDRDKKAEKYAEKIKSIYKENFFFYISRFSKIKEILKFHNQKVDAFIFDLGVSNTQLNQAKRGFSFSNEGPLDMRMGCQNNDNLTAEEVVNNFKEKELSDIFFKYGEEKKSFLISKEIIKARKEKKIKSTTELSSIINKLFKFKKNKINPSTRVFQALRIYLNDELNELEKVLNSILNLLEKNGKIIVVSFHSLEDKIVKNFFKANSGVFYDNYRQKPPKKRSTPTTLKIITKKPVVPGNKEIKINPRSRSAKLRAAQKIC